MSARDVLLPNQALGSMLRNFQNRLLAAERRARYPGVIRMAGGAASVLLPLYPTFVDLVSLEVERGRWLVTGGFWTNTTSNQADDQIDIYAQLYYGTTFGPLDHAGQVNVSGGAVDTLMPVWTIEVPSNVTIKMRGATSHSPSPQTSTAFDIYLLAFPG